MSDVLEFLSNPTSCIHILEKISTREILNDSALDAQANCLRSFAWYIHAIP